MRNVIIGFGLAATLAYTVSASGGGLSSLPESQARTDDAVLADFAARIRVYVDLHRCLEGPTPTVAVSQEWTEIYAAIEALGADIRAARANARHGNVFAPEIDALFRRLIREGLADVDPEELLAWLNEENPPGVVFTPRVNGRWPDEASFGLMPPKLLAVLPRLPDDLQYRFLNRDLVLWDAHANVIVDYMKNVIPR
jgi:hypothetical protein